MMDRDDLSEEDWAEHRKIQRMNRPATLKFTNDWGLYPSPPDDPDPEPPVDSEAAPPPGPEEVNEI